MFSDDLQGRSTDTGTRDWTASALLTIGYLGIVAGVQMSDRGLQAILLGPIQQSFRIGDSTIGALQGLAGVLVGSALAVPLARLGDRFSRKLILIGLIAGWALLMVLSALAPNFPLFFIGRAASGVTEFAMIPIVYSIIPDIAPERRRVAANLAFAALMAIGASAGFYFGETITELAVSVFPFAVEPWRKALLLLSLAGIPLLLAGLLVNDPPRRVCVAGNDVHEALLPFLRDRWRGVGMFVGIAGSLAVAVQALNPLIALALQRRFSADPGLIGQALGVITLVTSIGCLPVTGLLDARLRKRFGLAARPIIMAAGAMAAIPCVVALALAADVKASLIAVALFMFASSTANALVPTMLQDLTPAPLRARSFAVWSFTVSIFCAIGPVIAGMVSQTVLEGNLLTAITVTALPALLISMFCGLRASRDAA